MKIKVCGLKFPENIEAVSALNPDYMGFIFYGKSPRFAGELTVALLNSIPSPICKTAVFVNETKENISKLIELFHFDAIQLHGDENEVFCNHFKGNVRVIKAFGLDEQFDFKQLKKFEDSADLFLFDTKTSLHGGSGQAFNWNILNNYKLNVPFFLSGGISPDNLEEIKNISHPQFYGIDLNSRFEISPGIKDIDKLQKAFDTVKAIPEKINL